MSRFCMPELPPTSGSASRAPGISALRVCTLRPVGTESSTARLITVCCTALCTSTTGACPDTVIVSCSEPTFSSAFTAAVKFEGRSMPSRLNALNPSSVKVTAYMPGRRSMIWYRPSPSVVAALDFSINTELEASTVTPGRTAPLVSRTTPEIALWANAAAGRIARKAATRVARTKPLVRRMLPPGERWPGRGVGALLRAMVANGSSRPDSGVQGRFSTADVTQVAWASQQRTSGRRQATRTRVSAADSRSGRSAGSR